MSGCMCLSGYDGPDAVCYSAVVVKARKVHKCCECRREIAVKDRYERITGLWDGRWDTFRMCVDCSEIGLALACGEGRAFGVLWDDVTEYVFPTLGPDCFDKLESAQAKQYLRDRWIKWRGLDEAQP